MDTLTSNLLKKLELSLPSKYYFDENFYMKELEKIWSKNWIYVCHVSRLEKKLSYLTISIGKQSIIIVRNSEGKLKAFFNTCRHRGSILCEKETGVLKSKVFVCPYHQWSYSADTGKLIKVASFSELPNGFKKNEFSLFPVKLKVWRGCVFINLKSDASLDEKFLFQRSPGRLR